MAIRKADLREFIEEKSRKRKAVLKVQVRQALEIAFKPIVHTDYPELDSLERTASSLCDKMEIIRERYSKFGSNYTFTRQITTIRENLTSMRGDIINRNAGLAAYNLLDLGTNALDAGLEAAYHEVEKSMAVVVKEYRELVKVTDEVLAVVDGSRNGDKAYQKLDELGVDLSGFTPPNPNLPALIKLSADVCVLNGNCTEAGKP